MPFITTSVGGDGSGLQGPQGDPGTDALWNFTGEWVNGIDYAAGSVVEFQGSTYYHPNGQFSSYSPPTNGWLLVSAKGADGADGANGDDGTNGTDFGIYYLGNYNSSSGYVPNIAVVRGSDGQLYLAKASGQLGDPVGNTAEWEVWIPKGADGDDGTNGTSLTARGAWTDSENYAINDIVNFEGSSYVCIVGVTAGTDVAPYPQHIGAYWQLLAQGGSGSADIADFIFTEIDEYSSSISLVGDKNMTISAGADSDLYLTAGADLYIQTLGEGDDIHLNAADDIRFTTGNENIEFATPPSWRMNSEGRFILP